MRLERIRAKKMGPFQDIDLDLTKIEGTLIAIVGANGEGKSTLLELFAGSLYRKCPTRGSLADLATARDSMLETVVAAGSVPPRSYTLRHLVDNISGKSEALVLNEAGAPVLSSAKVRDFDAWAAKHLLPESVLYAGPFAAQGRRGFLDLSATERKKLLVQMLGLERLQKMAEQASENEKAARGDLKSLRDRLLDLPVVPLRDLEFAITEAETNVERTAQATQAAREALEKAKRAAADVAVQLEYVAARKAALKRLEEARAQVADIEKRIEKNREVLADRERIMGAVVTANRLTQELADANAQTAKSKAAFEAAKVAVRQAEIARTDTYRQWLPVEARCQALTARLADREAVLAADAKAEQLRVKVAELVQREAELEREIESLHTLIGSGKEDRINGLRGGLAIIETRSNVEHWVVAAKTLIADTEAALRLQKAPADLERAKGELGGARVVGSIRGELVVLRSELSKAEAMAARAGEIAQAEADLQEASQEYKRLEAEHEARSVALAASRLAAKAAEDLADHRYAFASNIATEIDNLAPLLAKRAPLEQAEARLSELSERLEPAKAAVTAAGADLAAIPVVEDVGSMYVGDHEHAVKMAEINEQTARATLTRAQQAHVVGCETMKKRLALADQIGRAEVVQADWAKLAADLGRDGVQAHELDAALPEINELANSLLHQTFGSRFTIELRSTRLDSSGKRELEALDFRVMDTVKGREADADTYSGGEAVIVGCAVSLALTTLACRRAGLERPTLVFDEAGAALDPENGRAWVRMLRLAAKHIGADKVLYVSHSSELAELADARIVVANGKAEVM